MQLYQLEIWTSSRGLIVRKVHESHIISIIHNIQSQSIHLEQTIQVSRKLASENDYYWLMHFGTLYACRAPKGKATMLFSDDCPWSSFAKVDTKRLFERRSFCSFSILLLVLQTHGSHFFEDRHAFMMIIRYLDYTIAQRAISVKRKRDSCSAKGHLWLPRACGVKINIFNICIPEKIAYVIIVVSLVE